MSINTYETVSIALNDLVKRGYDKSFSPIKDGLKCTETEEVIATETVTIIEHHRFEGLSDPDDMSVIYVITCKNGLKGTLIDAYGAYSGLEMARFLKNVKIEEPD